MIPTAGRSSSLLLALLHVLGPLPFGFATQRASHAGPRLRVVAILAALAVLVCSGHASAAAIRTTPPMPAQPEQVLAAAAATLVWPMRLYERPDLPGNTVQIAAGGEHGEGLAARVSVMDLHEAPALLDAMASQGMMCGLYHGRDTVIVHAGDGVAPGRAAGLIAWRCGPYLFTAEDRAGQGHEQQIAEAVYRAAETGNLCGIGASLIFVVEMGPGGPALAHGMAMAQAAQDYYDQNGYGHIAFDLAFLGADDPDKQGEGFVVPGASVASDDVWTLAEKAIAARLSTMELPPAVYIERAILLVAGDNGRPTVPPIKAQTAWLPDDCALDVQGRSGSLRAPVSNMMLLPASAPLGTWLHELGHTLRAQDTAAGRPGRIADRYWERPRAPFDDMGPWDLMARGCRWGIPRARSQRTCAATPSWRRGGCARSWQRQGRSTR